MDPRLAELRDLMREGAEPGPWRYVNYFDGSFAIEGNDGFQVLPHPKENDKSDVANYMLIAAMHHYVSQMIAEAEKLNEESK